MQHSEIVLSGQAVLQLTFDPGAFGHAPMTARCQLDHPFYIKSKGMSSDEETPELCKTTPLHSVLLPVRVVVILPELDRGASWDTVL